MLADRTVTSIWLEKIPFLLKKDEHSKLSIKPRYCAIQQGRSQVWRLRILLKCLVLQPILGMGPERRNSINFHQFRLLMKWSKSMSWSRILGTIAPGKQTVAAFVNISDYGITNNQCSQREEWMNGFRLCAFSAGQCTLSILPMRQIHHLWLGGLTLQVLRR